MADIIGVVSQKGGVGKSTISRMIACEYAKANWDVKLADMDASQGTSFQWQSRRLNNEISPSISVELFKKVDIALKNRENFDIIVFDGAPHSTIATLDIAKCSDVLILPTGTALDDLIPTVRLAQELAKNEVDIDKIYFLLSRVGNSDSELEEAKEYLKGTPFKLINQVLYEKTAYRRASDLGKSITESSHVSTNRAANLVMKEIVNILNKKTKRKVA